MPLGIDPIALRLKNYTETDEPDKKSFSSKELRACYQLGAERFGWSRRNPEPRSMREGRELVGWGMATGVWEAMMAKTAARAVLTRDGRLEVSCATADIGTGTYTILTQIAAETMGLRMEDVTTKIGDSSLPRSPVEGGSWTAASAGTAVQTACQSLREQLFKLARQMDASPLANASFERGHVRRWRDPPDQRSERPRHLRCRHAGRRRRAGRGGGEVGDRASWTPRAMPATRIRPSSRR